MKSSDLGYVLGAAALGVAAYFVFQRLGAGLSIAPPVAGQGLPNPGINNGIGVANPSTPDSGGISYSPVPGYTGGNGPLLNPDIGNITDPSDGTLQFPSWY